MLLSAAYDPGWTVTVDGTPEPTEMLSPALVGVKVGPGRHVVSFVYRGYGSYPLLFVLSLLALLCAGLGPMVWRRRLEAPVMRVARARGGRGWLVNADPTSSPQRDLWDAVTRP